MTKSHDPHHDNVATRFTQVLNAPEDNPDLIRMAEAMTILGSVIKLSRQSMITLDAKGKLRHWTATSGGYWLYRRSDVLAYRRELLKGQPTDASDEEATPAQLRARRKVEAKTDRDTK
jgi:hypothetical protein